MKRFSDLCFRATRVAMALAVTAPAAWANPSGGTVSYGSASIGSSGSTLTVNQMTSRAIINWNDFSIASGQTTRFVQPSATSAALNRVTGANPSSILGTLSANGQIYLINPNGITVGSGGVINTQSFIASTLGLTDAQFLAGGNMTFSGSSQAGVASAGQITALGGDVLLVGRTVRNTGTLTSQSGTTGLAAGSQVLFATGGSQRVFVQAGSGSGGTGVDQQGQIRAASAELAAAGGNVYALAINSAGPLTVNRVRMTGDMIALAGDTATSGDQVYTGAVTAQKSITLTSNSGALTFNGPVSEGFDLTTNSALNTSFNGAVIAYGRLHSNTTTSAGAVVINGGSVFSGGDQIYNGAARLGANTTLTSPYGGVIFNSAPLDGPYALVINSGLNTTFQKAVGATTPLSSLTVNITSPYGHIRPNGGLVRTSGDQVYNGPVYADNDATLTSSSGNIEFLQDVHAGFSLFTNSALSTDFNGPVSLGNGLTANGAVILQGGSIVSGGDQTYNGPITLNSSMSLNSLFGNLKFNGSIGGPTIHTFCGIACALTTNSAWNTTFNGGVVITSLTSTAREFFLSGGGILSYGAVRFNGPVMLGSDMTIGGDPGTDIFNGTVDGAYRLFADAKGLAVFNGAVGSIIPLAGLIVTNGDENVTFNGGSVRTTGDQLYAAQYTTLTLGSDTKFTSTAGNISFPGKVDGGYNLTTSSYLNTDFYGPVGSVTPLQSLTANITGSGKIMLDGHAVTTVNDQTYNGPVSANDANGGDILLNSSQGSLHFLNTLDGGHPYQLSSYGNIDFDGVVGGVDPLAMLNAGITGSGAVNINGGAITTVGPQTYSKILLGADATLTSAESGLAFESTIDGAHNFTASSNKNTDFFGAVGSVTPLLSLTANITGSGSINKHGNAITTTGSQTYNGPVNP